MHYVYEGCCGRQETSRICRLADYEASPGFDCPECGKPLKQIITAPRFLNNTAPFEAFKSPVDGSIITSQTALREHNARNGVVNLHDGYDGKAVDNFTKRNYQEELDKERRADLRKDAIEAIRQVADGYKPVVETEDALP